MKTETSQPSTAPSKKNSVTYTDEEKWSHLLPLLTRTSPFAPPNFTPGLDGLNFISEETRVLVVGAGGLGCELLKDLALSGFKDIEVIDMDTIDVSNLNRQFLFRLKDTGKHKAEVAAAFVNKRIKGANVKAHTQNIMEFDKTWYRRFNIVIAGLDNIEARDWLNKTLLDLVEFDEDGQISFMVPLIDGGTTGFAGQARVIIPYQTACYRCTLASLPPEEGFHLCTIASKPRKPDHCIAYALLVEWPRLKSFTNAKKYELGPPPTLDEAGNPQVEEGKIKLNKDDPQHLTWLLERALERAEEFNIKGVTYFMTMQVVKNIIPALASTNAIISAACVNEALKIIAQSHPRLNSYFQYYANSGISCRTFPYARNPECDVCTDPLTWKLKASDSLEVFLGKVKKLFPEPAAEEGEKKLKVRDPTLSFSDGTLLYAEIPGMDYSEDLPKPLFAVGVMDKTMIIATNGERTRRIIIKIVK